MPLLATVLTQLVLVVTEGTVERGEFSELVAFVVVLAFGGGGGLQYEMRKINTKWEEV